MVLIIGQSKLLINQFNHININQPVQMEDVNNVNSPFEGNINPGYTTGPKNLSSSNKGYRK